jgi:hypothetical protein
MMHASMELARRLDAAEALDGVACAEAQRRINPAVGAEVLELGGGFAIFVGVESPLTHALGLGMRGAVSAEDMDRMEEFYRSYGTATSLEMCPLADASLVELLGARGYRITEFNNVLARGLAGAEIAPAENVRLAAEDAEHLWSRTVGRGFLEKEELTPEEMDVGRTIWNVPDARCYLALRDGQAAAAAAMAIHSGVATLFADSTMLGSRGAGLQDALIRTRLRAAVGEGCDFAVASTLPGSISQRNYERNGFQVAYTKITLAR